jgi:type I restriction enzyme M protein
VLSNRKASSRRGKVQLIDASAFWVPRRKSLGDKRRDIPREKAADILALLKNFQDGETRKLSIDGAEEEVVVSRVYPTTKFGFRKITVERPLRLNFQASAERLARLEEERGFLALAQSKKKGPAAVKEEEEGRTQQEAIRSLLRSLPGKLYSSRSEFISVLEKAAADAGYKLSAPTRKAILAALSERDEKADICRDDDGKPEPDSELRDSESVPLDEDIRAYFAREVSPHLEDPACPSEKWKSSWPA